MELKPGYKQTEVGVVPEDWEVALLQDACRESITYGIVQCGPHVENGIPYIRVSDMDRAELDVDRMLRTSRSIAARFVRSTVSEGDLVYALRGRLGEVRQIPREIAGANLTQGTARLAPNERLTGGYLLWAMRNPGSLAQAATEAKGTTFREITLADLRKVRILVPARAEQEAIAEALSDADALIGSLEQLVTKKRQVKQGAMQELLTGKKRLAGFNGQWEVNQLGNLADMGSGGTPPSSVAGYYDGDIPWVAISDMTKAGKLILSTDRNLSQEGLIHSAAQLFPTGTVLYAMYASLGECSIAGVPLCTSQAILGIRPNKRIDGEFLFYRLTSLKTTVKSIGQQGAQANLNKGMVQAFQFALPPVPEQTAIAAVLSDMDAEIAELEAQLAKTRALKQGMMQQLLAGKIRLVKPSNQHQPPGERHASSAPVS